MVNLLACKKSLLLFTFPMFLLLKSVQIALKQKFLLIEVITYDCYEQWVCAHSTALSVALAGAQEKAQQPVKWGNAALKGKKT